MGSFMFAIPKTGEYSNIDERMMSLRVLIALYHKTTFSMSNICIASLFYLRLMM